MTRAFGTIERLPSGRYRARYPGPDGRRYTAPTTFVTKKDARDWLALRQAEIIRKAWQPPEASTPKATRLTFADYAETWLAQRDLKARTREHYRRMLDQRLLPKFGSRPLTSITADDVRSWHATPTLTDKPTLRAHAYGLLRTIFASAVNDELIAANPCRIVGAGSAKRKVTIRPASLEEIEKLADAMPQQYEAMVLLAAWCALRFGELTELRRKDLVLDPDAGKGTIRVERAVVRTADGFRVTTPKSDAGRRDVAIPPHLVPVIAEHLAKHVGPERDSLLFPAAHGGHLAAATLHKQFVKARQSAGRPDLRFHDLRHSGAVLAAQTGATLAELMSRLGHSTPQAAMRYQHAAAERDQAIAEALSRMVLGQ